MSNKVKDEYTIYSDDVSYLPEDNKLKDSTEEIEFAKLRYSKYNKQIIVVMKELRKDIWIIVALHQFGLKEILKHLSC